MHNICILYKQKQENFDLIKKKKKIKEGSILIESL
jgi:hypothetical protein